MRHYSCWPVAEGSVCGAEEEFTTSELDLVTCSDCRRIVIVNEIEGRAS